MQRAGRHDHELALAERAGERGEQSQVECLGGGAGTVPQRGSLHGATREPGQAREREPQPLELFGHRSLGPSAWRVRRPPASVSALSLPSSSISSSSPRSRSAA